MADSREEFEKAREILDFTFNGDELLTGRDWDWELWQAAQAAIPPEIEMWKQYQQNSAIMCNELTEQLSAANQRITEPEERICVADAEEPVGYVQKGIYVNSAGRLAISNEQLPVYLHAQIPAEVELKAKIAELEATIADWNRRGACGASALTQMLDMAKERL